MSRDVDAVLDDLWAWAEGLRRGVVTGTGLGGAGSAVADDVTRDVLAGLVDLVADGVERAAAAGDRTLPAAVRDLFGLP